MRKPKPKLSVIQQRHPGTTLLGLFTLLALGLYLTILITFTTGDFAKNSPGLNADRGYQLPAEEIILTAGVEQPARF